MLLCLLTRYLIFKLKKNILLIFCFSFLLSNQEVIYFDSANPFSFNDIIENFENLDNQEVHGFLTLPQNIEKNEKVPLVIGVAGSKGWSNHHLDYLENYRSAGIATFELRSFKSRGVSSTVGSQIEVTHAMMILDSYRALEALSSHPNIDIDKVAITGWSLGGGVALFSGWNPLRKAINSKYEFAAHLSLYPPCFVKPISLDFTDSPMHILIGELDNWVPAKACEELVESMIDEGVNIKINVLKDAHHSFDRTTPVVKVEDAYNFSECRLRMNDEGSVLMNYLNVPMNSPLLQKIGLFLCAQRGPTMGGHQPSRMKSLNFSKNFMIKNLLD